jgi:uncharacterized membrane protein YeaQ/YmgE (transglycosylase-associated protein family)
MVTVLGWIFFGLIVGAIAKLVMPGRDPGGIIVTILLGIVGGAIGLWIGAQVNTGFLVTVLIQIVVAALLVTTFAALARRR